MESLKRAVKWLWYARRHVPLLNTPIPWRFPPGYWFLIYPDEMGLNLFSSGRLFSFEENKCRFLARFIQPGMVCFDIGANQGFFTMLLSRYVGCQGRVFAFEPTQLEFSKLKRNMHINRSENIVLENMAVGHKEGIVDMIICLDGHGSRSSLHQPAAIVQAQTVVEQVPITNLNAFVRNNNLKQLDFIKLDVEGAERDVLRGGLEVLNTFRPVLLIEMADITTQQFGYMAEENYRYLENYGFVWYEATPAGYLKAAPRKERYEEDLIAVPREKLSQLSNLVETY